MDLSDLYPFPVFVTWEGQPIELRPFDLRAITWAERFFFKDGKSGFYRMNEILRNKEGQTVFFNTVIDVIYHLGEKDFQKIGVENVVDLKKTISNTQDSTERLDKTIDSVDLYRVQLYDSRSYEKAEQLEQAIKQALDYRNQPNIESSEIVIEFKDALEQVIQNSFTPAEKEDEQTGGAIFQMLKAREKKQENQNKPAWEQIYTAFFIASGISIDDFYSLTMKQINAIYPEIDFNKAKDFESQATLHGMKLKHRVKRKEQAQTFTEDEVSKFEKMHEKLMEGNRIN